MRGIWVAAAAVAAASLSAPAGALADWPVYGHDLANSRNAGPAGPPRSEAGSLTRAWTFNSPTGDFTGTPVVAGGVLVAGNNGGWVYALDAVTGKVRWSRDLGSPINGSAAIDGNTAFVPVAKPGAPRLVALSLEDGSVRWSSILINQASASVYGSPTFWRGSVYIGTSGPNTDDTRARGSVVALDESSGAIRWQTFMVPPDRDGAAVWSTPAIDPATGRLYVGTGNNYHPPTTNMEDSIVALDAADGHVVGHYQATKDDSFAGGDNPAGGPDFDFGASPNLFTGAHGEQFVGEGQKSGTYWAVDRATMQPVWSANVGPGGPLGGILGSTAFDGERIYGGDTLDGQVFALGRDGSISWQSADPGGLHTGPATIAGGVLYNTDPSGVLDVRDPATGLILGKLPLGNPALGGVSAAGSAIYVAVGTGPLPQPAPQSDNPGSIVAFGDTSRSAGSPNSGPAVSRARLRVVVRPRRVHVRRRAVLRFRATRAGRPVRGVKVRVGRKRGRTKHNGRVTIRLRFHRAGTRFAHAGARGMRGTRVRIEVIR